MNWKPFTECQTLQKSRLQQRFEIRHFTSFNVCNKDMLDVPNSVVHGHRVVLLPNRPIVRGEGGPITLKVTSSVKQICLASFPLVFSSSSSSKPFDFVYLFCLALWMGENTIVRASTRHIECDGIEKRSKNTLCTHFNAQFHQNNRWFNGLTINQMLGGFSSASKMFCFAHQISNLINWVLPVSHSRNNGVTCSIGNFHRKLWARQHIWWQTNDGLMCGSIKNWAIVDGDESLRTTSEQLDTSDVKLKTLSQQWHSTTTITTKKVIFQNSSSFLDLKHLNMLCCNFKRLAKTVPCRAEPCCWFMCI